MPHIDQFASLAINVDKCLNFEKIYTEKRGLSVKSWTAPVTALTKSRVLNFLHLTFPTEASDLRELPNSVR